MNAKNELGEGRFSRFLANSWSIGDEKPGNMHRPGHFAADFLQARQAARRVISVGMSVLALQRKRVRFYPTSAVSIVTKAQGAVDLRLADRPICRR